MNTILNASNLQFVTSVNTIQQSLNKVENELSSGLAVMVASDAPDQVSPLLQLHADIAQNTQIQQDLTSAQTITQTADQSLSSASTLLNEVSTLAAEGLGLGTTAATRQSLSGQVTSLLKQMVTVSNVSTEGSFVFGGDSNQAASYNFDSTTNTVQRLQITTATTQVQDGSGGSFAVGLSANQIFDSRDNTDTPIASQNVFAAIASVASALASNDTTALQTAAGNLPTVSAYLSQQQTFYGNVETQITSSLSTVSNLATSYQKDLSSRQDADATSAIVELQQYSTALQAALAAQAKRPQTTLFDLIR